MVKTLFLTSLASILALTTNTMVLAQSSTSSSMTMTNSNSMTMTSSASVINTDTLLPTGPSLKGNTDGTSIASGLASGQSASAASAVSTALSHAGVAPSAGAVPYHLAAVAAAGGIGAVAVLL